jgi:diacylglycerol kinase (ATP)
LESVTKSVLLLHNARSKTGARCLRRCLDALEAERPAPGAPVATVSIDDLDAHAGIPARLVVLGGDGSVNAAAQWLHDRGAACPIAIVPAGTGNNLARGLGIPRDVRQALALALRGTRARRVDGVLFRWEGTPPRIMIQTSALGFPARIAARYDEIRRNRFGRALSAPAGPYVYRILALSGLVAQKRRELRGDPLPVVRCSYPGGEIEDRLFAIFLGNERSLGGNFIPCPRASVDDGVMDLCLVRAGTGASYLDLFRRIARGDHLSLERTVEYRQTPGPLEIRVSEPSPLLIDGDIKGNEALYRVEMLPGRFEVVVPEGGADEVRHRPGLPPG